MSARPGSNSTISNGRIGDTERQSIEVGVIVMGLCCVSIVGCALVILQVRAVAITRRRRRRRQRNSVTGSNTGTNSPDPFAASAPPSYNTVLRNPRLYPLSPRSSISNSTNVDQFMSLRSGFSSLTLRLLHVVSGSRVTPEASPTITRSASPTIVEVQSHNIFCSVDAQLENSYHNRAVETDGAETERAETPPPAYPGIIGADIIEIRPSRLDVGVSSGSPRRHSWNGWVNSPTGSSVSEDRCCNAGEIRRRPSFMEIVNSRGHTHLELELEPASPPPEYPFHEIDIHCFHEQALRETENDSNGHLREQAVMQSDNSLQNVTYQEGLDATFARISNHGSVTCSDRSDEEGRQNRNSQQYPHTSTFKGLEYARPSSSSNYFNAVTE